MEEEVVKKIIQDLLSKLTIEGSVEIIETADGKQFVIKSPESGLLIGENGNNLVSLNHIVKRIASKNIKEDFNFSLDINDYQLKKIEDLKNLARLNAQRVRYFKKEVYLKPMTSFERRVVHSVLSDCPDITTTSFGKDPERRIIIKPYP